MSVDKGQLEQCRKLKDRVRHGELVSCKRDENSEDCGLIFEAPSFLLVLLKALQS